MRRDWRKREEGTLRLLSAKKNTSHSLPYIMHRRRQSRAVFTRIVPLFQCAEKGDSVH